jgi:membrane-associated phospholipid phosphatase
LVPHRLFFHQTAEPSGHTQVPWLYLAIRFKKPWLWWLGGAFIVFIPLSRLYLVSTIP